MLILKGDRFSGEALSQVVLQDFPSAAVQVISRLRDARAFLAASRVDLLVLGMDLVEGEALDLLSPGSLRERRFQQVLVVSGLRNDRTLALLCTRPIDGVFDPDSEGVEQFAQALRALAAGRSCWSPSVLERLREPGRKAVFQLERV